MKTEAPKRVKLTPARIKEFHCEAGKKQSFLWSSDVRGLGVRATEGSTDKRYIFQTLVHGKDMRLTIGGVDAWGVELAHDEARRLRVIIDQGGDPRQVRADQEVAKEAAKQVKEAEAAALRTKELTESVSVQTAWEAYIESRSTSMKNGKPEWGEKQKAHHVYFVQAGGVPRKSGWRVGESKVTQPGILVPLMSMRLADLNEDVIAAWLDKAAKKTPTMAGQAFRALRAFLNWAANKKRYPTVAHADACRDEEVTKRVPAPKKKKNDRLRKAMLKPWFEQVQLLSNPVQSAYLQCLVLTGPRRNELAAVKWKDVDFKWKSIKLRDKVEGDRTIPLTPYVEHLIAALPRTGEFVFYSERAKSGHLVEPTKAHNTALEKAELPHISIHGLRRSFASLADEVKMPEGVAAQIMGHKPSAIAEKFYIERELDFLFAWHSIIEAWILQQAGIEYKPKPTGLRLVA